MCLPVVSENSILPLNVDKIESRGCGQSTQLRLVEAAELGGWEGQLQGIMGPALASAWRMSIFMYPELVPLPCEAGLTAGPQAHPLPRGGRAADLWPVTWVEVPGPASLHPTLLARPLLLARCEQGSRELHEDVATNENVAGLNHWNRHCSLQRSITSPNTHTNSEVSTTLALPKWYLTTVNHTTQTPAQ